MALIAGLTGVWPIVALVTAVAAFSYGWSVYERYQKQRRYGCSDPPKYPHRDPFGYDLVAARESATLQGRPAAFDQSLFAAYGQTFEALRWGTWRQKMIWTSEPSNVQTIAALSFDHFEFRTLRQSFGPFMGNGLLTTDGAKWAHSGEMVRPVFRRSRIGDFAVFEVHVKRFLDLLPRDGSTVDVQPLLKRLFLDSAMEFFLGRSMDSLLPSANPEAEAFLAAFDESLRGMTRTTWLGRFGWVVQWDSSLVGARNKVYRFINVYVDEALRRANNELGPSEVQVRGDYVLIDEMAKDCKDRLRLRHEIINIFLPARDTTGIALGLVLYNLARSPGVLKKLRTQVLEHILPETNITFDLLKSIPYLRYVLNESLRLRSPIHWSQRTCCKDCILPTGGGSDGKAPILVTKGQAVTINVYALHRDKKVWGEDAEQFRPERWETERPTWEYLPFLGGPRICPAQQMALAECSYILVRLLQEFKDIENRDPEPWAEEIRLQSESRHGVKIGLIPATPGE